MNILYNLICSDKYNIQYKTLKSDTMSYIIAQGSYEGALRIKRAYKNAQKFYTQNPQNFLKPISIKLNDDLASAMYEYKNIGMLKGFLEHQKPYMHYSIGKKVGRALKSLHQYPLSAKQIAKGKKRDEIFVLRLSEYLNSKHRLPHDEQTIDILCQRFNKFKCQRPVLRYGNLNIDNIFIDNNLQIIFKPSSSSIIGDPYEDLALLEFYNSQGFDIFISGVIDGYFYGKVPAEFWVNFALFSAFYSLYKSSKIINKHPDQALDMLLNFKKIKDDFANFTRPMAKWYKSKELKDAKQKCMLLGL